VIGEEGRKRCLEGLEHLCMGSTAEKRGASRDGRLDQGGERVGGEEGHGW
jgi:hypothetical protein